MSGLRSVKLDMERHTNWGHMDKRDYCYDVDVDVAVKLMKGVKSKTGLLLNSTQISFIP